jgi:hypothetical protein
MSTERSTQEPSLSLTLQKQIDAVCDRFEAALKAGQQAEIERFLGALSASETPWLLR